MNKRVKIDTAELLLQDLLRSRVREMHREPEVLEAEAQVGKWLDCRAGITTKELAPILSVKSGILQSACSTCQKMDADLVKSALMHTARLINSLSKRSEKYGDKSAVAILKITRRIGLRNSKCGASEVFIDFTEELKHTEANPMCSIH